MNTSGEGNFPRPVGFTPSFQHNVGWDDTIKLPRGLLSSEKASHSRQVPDCEESPTAVLPNHWSPDSPSFPYLDDEPRIHETSTGKGAPVGNADGKTSRLRRVPGFTEPLNDLAPVTGPSPRSFVSIPSTFLDDSHVKLLGKWFRQIIPLSMRHTLLPDTNYIPIPQPPRFHTPGHRAQSHQHFPSASSVLKRLP